MNILVYCLPVFLFFEKKPKQKSLGGHKLAWLALGSFYSPVQRPRRTRSALLFMDRGREKKQSPLKFSGLIPYLKLTCTFFFFSWIPTFKAHRRLPTLDGFWSPRSSSAVRLCSLGHPPLLHLLTRGGSRRLLLCCFNLNSSQRLRPAAGSGALEVPLESSRSLSEGLRPNPLFQRKVVIPRGASLSRHLEVVIRVHLNVALIFLILRF